MKPSPAHPIVGLIMLALAVVITGCGGGASNEAIAMAPADAASKAPPADPVAAVNTLQAAALLGDMDGDGQPTVGDAIRILRIVVGLDPDDLCADANQNDSADVGDAIMVLRCVVGLDDWPIGECGVPVSGSVTSWDSQQGVADVTVRIAETGQLTRTDANGDYRLTVPSNATYTASASKKKYNNFGASERVVYVGDTSVTGVDFEVASVPMPPGGGRIYGFVLDASGNPVAGVTVTAGDRTDTTDANGEYAIDLPAGSYTATPSGGGYTFSPATRDVTVTNGQVTRVDAFAAD